MTLKKKPFENIVGKGVNAGKLVSFLKGEIFTISLRNENTVILDS